MPEGETTISDNVTIPATGSGTATPVVATDDVGGVHYQRVKLDVGGDGASVPVTTAAPLPVALRCATGTQTSVASSASDGIILAANAARLGATITNDSTSILYLLLANATSTSSVYTVKLASGAYYEVPFGYTAVIKGIWASANGYARVTELT